VTLYVPVMLPIVLPLALSIACKGENGTPDSQGGADDTGALPCPGNRPYETFFPDDDADGYGRTDEPLEGCQPTPKGYSLRPDDCDDTNPDAHPGQQEDCATAFDDDCDGTINQASGVNLLNCTQFSIDTDADGFGNAGDSLCLCEPDKTHTAPMPGDCDNRDPKVHLGTPTCVALEDEVWTARINGTNIGEYVFAAELDEVAGSEIVIGSAQATSAADVDAPPKPVVPGRNGRPARPAPDQPRLPPAPEPDVGGDVPGGPVKVAPEVSARLSSGGFVFPIYGTASFGDSFGAPRPDIPSGWHHGEDIFAAAGTPLLAVADGTLHTIGFNKIGGYRLWLRDTEGDEFYYAHLSAYSPLAVEGRSVKAGDVIGFVGNTGDADGGAPHLHFEIHPASMAGLGYDGVVAPYSILLAWRRAQDISFSAGRIYVPTGPGSSTTLPPPGAVLLEADDIGSTSGLVPGALEKVLNK